jgi:hypothetical protein
MQRLHSHDDMVLLRSNAKWSKLNHLAQLKALDKEWTQSWKSLTSDIDTKASASVQSVHTTWQTPCNLPMWALIDIAHNHRSLERDASRYILDLVTQTEPFYESLRDGEFRLLQICDGKENDILQCKVFNTSLRETVPQYFALSYYWGPSTQLQKVIFLNGRATVVGGNLFSCLSHFRQVRGLASVCHWIDALCIRQDDVQEKNVQIPLMGRIYSIARSVNIWLGPEQRNSGYVLDTMYESELQAMTDIKFIEGFDQLLQRPWFERLWVRRS